MNHPSRPANSILYPMSPRRLLENIWPPITTFQRMAITPGLDFGENAPQRHVRFAYTVAQDKLQEGVARLARHLGQ